MANFKLNIDFFFSKYAACYLTELKIKHLNTTSTTTITITIILLSYYHAITNF